MMWWFSSEVSNPAKLCMKTDSEFPEDAWVQNVFPPQKNESMDPQSSKICLLYFSSKDVQRASDDINFNFYLEFRF